MLGVTHWMRRILLVGFVKDQPLSLGVFGLACAAYKLEDVGPRGALGGRRYIALGGDRGMKCFII